ncbi:hypothetical protein BC827DRAFT_1164869 [Russula dissimulans]|nr:hypothetical protein BC827DRAFT_1164869 [Russula dissimulans]
MLVENISRYKTGHSYLQSHHPHNAGALAQQLACLAPSHQYHFCPHSDTHSHLP